MQTSRQWLRPPINCFVWLVTWLTLGLCFRIRRVGCDRLPRRGGVLVISNHVSYFDPPLLNLALRRTPSWLAMIELFKPGFWQWFFTNGGVIPIDRNAPGSAPMKEAIRRLREGGVLVLFPEGGIHYEADSVLGGNPELKPGAALIAMKAGVPIMPAIIEGARQIYDKHNWCFRRCTIRLTLGEPFQLDHACDRDTATSIMREKLLALAAEVKSQPT